MNFQADTEKQQNAKNSNKAVIILTVFLALYVCVASIFIFQNYVNLKFLRGEYDSYMLPTIAILNHGSMIITEDDIQQAAIDFPECYSYLRERYDSQRMVPTKDNSGLNPYYYCTYSVACIPLKLLLKIFHLPQIYAFPFTNLALLLLSFLFAYQNLNVSNASKLLCVALLAINPIFYYLIWCSAEVFIFSMLTLSLVYYLNYKYKRAALFLSLAGTLNVTVMFFGFIMIGDFFYHLWKEKEGPFITRKNLLATLTFGACFLPVFLPFIHNMIYVNQVNDTFRMFQTEDLPGRFVSYLFDLNLGFFPYMPILFLLLLFVLWHAVRNKSGRCLWLTFSMFGIVLMYSCAMHINCGMSGISRYGAWTTPFLILIITAFFPYHAIKQWIYILTVSISLIITGVLLPTMPFASYQMSTLSRFVLNHAPNLYNPLYSTFNCRVNNIDGGYYYLEYTPIIYSDTYGNIRKILISQNEGEALLQQIIGEAQGIDYLATQLEKIPADGDVHYVNIPAKYSIQMNNYFLYTDGECILDLNKEITQQNGIDIISEEIDLENDTYYRVEVIYSGEYHYATIINCDFFGGETYDSPEQESQFTTCQKLDNGDYLVDCLLFSGDASLANQQTRIRVLDYSGDISYIKELRVIQLEKK